VIVRSFGRLASPSSPWWKSGVAPRRARRPGVPNAAAALGWGGDASPVECSQTFTTGC